MQPNTETILAKKREAVNCSHPASLPDLVLTGGEGILEIFPLHVVERDVRGLVGRGRAHKWC